MYFQYFGLSEAPFSIAVNPRYLYMSHRHRDALAHLLYGVGAGGGFIVLTGEVGTGKTTINRALLEQLPDDADIAIVLNPALDSAELLATVCDELAIAYDRDDASSLKALTDRLHRFLLDNHGRGRKTVLLIDEAQHLSFPVLEQIRLLTNLETDSEKLLHIILIGQPELAAMLERPELRQLNQRVTARYNLEPLSPAETGAYIRHRLQVAGLGPGTELFPPRVVRAIHRHTRGVPRLINLLCDRMLLGAYGQSAPRVDRAMLRQALREVTGSDGGPRLPSAALPGAALLALLLVALGWWALLAGGEGEGENAAAAPEPARAPASAGAVEAPAVSGADAAATGAPTGIADAAPREAAGPSPPPWQLSPAGALRALWALYGGTPVPAEPCGTAGLRCETGSASTWSELSPLQRPVILELVTTSRFAAGALLLALDGTHATVAVPAGTARVPLASLAAPWSGEFRYLWRAPADFDGLLRRGDVAPAVSAVADRFARLDGQGQPLADERFNDRLAERVRLFQRQTGLVEDGLVGAETLKRLNLAAGLVPDPLPAWERLVAAGFTP